MPRHVLTDDQLHPAIRDKVAQQHRDIVDEVLAATQRHRVVVVGMGQNPMCKKACKALDAAGVRHHYLEYGNYFNTWRRRNALKMWTGWPTFPMVFIKGQLVGGADEVRGLVERGEIKALLGKEASAGDPRAPRRS